MSIVKAKNKLNKNSGPGDDDNYEKTIELYKEKMQLNEDARKLSKQQFFDKYKNIPKFSDPKYLDENYRTDFTSVDNDYDFKNLRKAALDIDYDWLGPAIKREMSKIEMRDKGAQTSADYINNYIKNLNLSEEAKNKIKLKYGDVDNYLTPEKARQSYYQGIIAEARDRIKSGKDVKVPGYPDSEMTCISGTCTLAANQGVDFKDVPGKKDDQGRNIPILNADFYKYLDKSGYEEVPVSQMSAGDFIQYDNMETGVPKHMEIVLDNSKAWDAPKDLFNNYSLTNDKVGLYGTPGLSQRVIKSGEGGKLQAFHPGDKKPHMNARVLRIKDDAVVDAYLRKNAINADKYKKELELSKAYAVSPEKKQLEDLNNTLKSKNIDILGSDKALFDEIVTGIKGKYAKDPEGLKAELLKKTKSPVKIGKIIDALYSQPVENNTPAPAALPPAPARMTAN